MHPPLRTLLESSGLPFEWLVHPAAVTAQAAAEARGTELRLGGKSILLLVERLGPVIVVVGSDRRIEGRLFRRALGVQRYRFATVDELLSATGLPPGAVPAFARPLFEAELVVGEDVLERGEIVFAAGSPSASVRMRTADWLAVARPRVVPCFTQVVSPP